MPENIKYTGAPTLTPEEARRTAEIPGYRLNFPEVRLTRAGAEAGAEIGRATGVLGATMHTLGQSIGTLGQAMTGAGNEMWNRAVGLKQLEAETKVNNATVAWELGQTKRDEEFRSKSGEQANSQALDAHLKSSEEERQKVKGALGSQYEQKLFDQQTTRPFITSARQAAAHAGDQTRIQAKQAIEARLGLIGNRVANATEDADRAAALQEGARIYATERKYAHGESDDQVHRGYMIWSTKAIAAAAERTASDGDTAHAMRILEDNRAEMDEVDSNIYRVAYDRIKRMDDNNKARTISDMATGDKDETLEIKENRAREELKRIGRDKPDDPLVDLTMSRLRNKDAMDRQKLMQDRQQAQDFVEDVYHGRRPEQQGKKPPTTPEEAMAVPGMDEMWPKLRPSQQDALEAVLKANARGNFNDTAETRAVHKYWAGMFDLDPDEMRRKYDEDHNWIDKLEIPESYRKDLETRELKMLREGIKADKKDAPAKTIVDRGKQESLVPQNITKHQSALLTYYVSAEIKAWRTQHPQKFPTREDENGFINAARRQVQVPGMLWGTNTVEEYRRDLTKLPNQEYQKARKAYMDTHSGASEEEVTRAILDAYVLRKLRAEQGAKPVTTTKVTPGG